MTPITDERMQTLADKIEAGLGVGYLNEIFEGLRDTRIALESLLGEQNGPPLERHRKSWEAACGEGWRVLGRTIATEPSEEPKLPKEFHHTMWTCPDPDCNMTNFGNKCMKCGRSKP